MTLNEAHNIEFCLRSLRPWCDEVIVVDMMSDDGTQELAWRYADFVLTHDRVGFVEPARRKAFAAAGGDWIINIDADEIVAPALAQYLREFVEDDPPYDVVLLPRANVFLGRWLRSTPWWPGKPRFFRRGMMGTSERIHHGFQPVPGARVARIPKDEALSLWHYSYPSVDGMTTKMNSYTTVEAVQALEAGRGDPKLREFFTGPLRALAPYILRRGYRDGIAGLAYAMNMAYYHFLTAAKRWDQQRAPARQAQYNAMREEMLSGFAGESAKARPATADAPLARARKKAAS